MKLKSLPISPAVKDALYAVFHGCGPDENLDPELVGEFDLCAGRGTDDPLGLNSKDDASAHSNDTTTSDPSMVPNDASLTTSTVSTAAK